MSALQRVLLMPDVLGEHLPLVVLVELVGPVATEMLLATSLVDLELH